MLVNTRSEGFYFSLFKLLSENKSFSSIPSTKFVLLLRRGETITSTEFFGLRGKGAHYSVIITKKNEIEHFKVTIKLIIIISKEVGTDCGNPKFYYGYKTLRPYNLCAVWCNKGSKLLHSKGYSIYVKQATQRN